MKCNYFIYLLAILLLNIGCSEDFLLPKPLSFYDPDETFVDSDALEALLGACAKNLRDEWIGDAPGIITEQIFSEVAVEGTTDKSGPAQNMNLQITPDANLNSENTNRIGWYWESAYKGIKYANTIISRIDNIEFQSDEEKNAILGSAYFYRAYHYYRLTNQFGDVPFIGQEIKSPRLDFYSTKRNVILHKMKDDLEFASKWVRDNVLVGEVSNGAVNHLLTKVNLSLGEFEAAVRSATEVIENSTYSLVTERFGVDLNDDSKNVIWDLHQKENKAMNKEGLFLIVDRFGLEGNSSKGMRIMRQCVPNWGRNIFTPSGNEGIKDATGLEIDLSSKYGRGIGRCRGTSYSTKFIWKDTGDLRHSEGNWIDMEDLVYNNPALKDKEDFYYGEHLQLYSDDGVLLCRDTIRSWFGWPHYKIYIEDNINNRPEGGHTDWYVFRLAETYLLRAEAYYWLNELEKSKDDINVVRNRASADDIKVDDINIGTIFDERARELFYEEPRKTELTRVSYILASFDNVSYKDKKYSLNDFSDDNFFYDRIMEYTDFYNQGVSTGYGVPYTLSAYHVLWPIPADAILANTEGAINQNKGYSGYENNVDPLDDIK